MNLVEKLIYRAINGKVTIDKPIFIKDFEKDNGQLKDLIRLSSKVASLDKKELIDRDISFLKYGLDGEANVAYELKSSYLPMLCLHDIRIEYNHHVAQIDFIIITKKFIYVLETKKLSGDIEINADGEFIRTIKTNGGKFIKKEGMYSPISQNERHVKVLFELLSKEDGVKRFPIKSLVVIANPKTIVNKTKAPKDIQKNICKYDQLPGILKKDLEDPINEFNLLEKSLYEMADTIMKFNKPIKFDCEGKYSL